VSFFKSTLGSQSVFSSRTAIYTAGLLTLALAVCIACAKLFSALSGGNFHAQLFGAGIGLILDSLGVYWANQRMFYGPTAFGGGLGYGGGNISGNTTVVETNGGGGRFGDGEYLASRRCCGFGFRGLNRR